ncbi:MAG TPA: amidohydrolase family protein [Stellaceae bacterium]|nr:amidohydrolase family protein [Stellaceae bacterium]
MIFDADAHFSPKFAYDRMAGEFRHLRPRHIKDGTGTTMYFNGRLHPGVSHSFPEAQTCDFDRRMRDIDRFGIDWQLLFPSHSGLFQEIDDPGAAAALCQNHNDGMAEVEKKSKGRLISTAVMPMQFPDEAVAELQRIVKVHGMRAVVVCPNVDGKNIDDIRLWDFYAEAERLGVAICFHGDADSKLLGWQRMERWRLYVCLGFPFDYMMAITTLIYSGLLDRFPKLKILFAEGGVSYLPFLEDRLMDTVETFRSPLAHDNFAIRGRPANKRPPKEYFDRFHHVIGLDESLMNFVVERYGADKFMIGTDYPHPDAHMNVAKYVDELSTISKETLEMITWKNAARFFGVEAPRQAAKRPKLAAAE